MDGMKDLDVGVLGFNVARIALEEERGHGEERVVDSMESP
jgi:hypothetical protein